MSLADVLKAHAYAQGCLEGIDEIEVKDSPDRLAEAMHAVLWEIVRDQTEPRDVRYSAAVAQYLYSGYSEVELTEAIDTDREFCVLLRKAMAKRDWLAGPHRDAVFQDCLFTLAHQVGQLSYGDWMLWRYIHPDYAYWTFSVRNADGLYEEHTKIKVPLEIRQKDLATLSTLQEKLKDYKTNPQVLTHSFRAFSFSIHHETGTITIEAGGVTTRILTPHDKLGLLWVGGMLREFTR